MLNKLDYIISKYNCLYIVNTCMPSNDYIAYV